MDLMVGRACFPVGASMVDDSSMTTWILFGASWLNQLKAVQDLRRSVLSLERHSGYRLNS